MKRILLNKQYQFVALVIAAIILLIFASSFKTDKVTTPVSTIVLNCSSIENVNTQINDYSKKGYVFKSLSPYTINVNAKESRYDVNYVMQFDYKNNFILILQK